MIEVDMKRFCGEEVSRGFIARGVDRVLRSAWLECFMLVISLEWTVDEYKRGKPIDIAVGTDKYCCGNKVYKRGN